MSFVARNKPSKGDDHRSRSSLYEDDNADQHEEYQSTRSELPAEIPDSQPDPYLPSEIPDSQPDLFYEKDLPFGDLDYSEVSSQLPIGDHGDLRLGDASAFDLADYDLGDEGVVGPSDCSPNGQENIVSRVNRFDRLPRRQVGDSVLNQAFISSSTVDTEIIPGGTRLTERLKDRVPLHEKGVNCNGRLPIEAPQYKGLDAMEEECTQLATQPVARTSNSMLSEQDESDIICILLPTSPAAHEAVELTAKAAPQHILQNHGISHIYEAPDGDTTTGGDTRSGDDSDDAEDLNTQPPDPNQPKWNLPAKDIALRFSSKVHNLGLGFTFGRNPVVCDLLLSNNYEISNRHFRIFMMDNGSLMIEDTSSNGTIIGDRVINGPRAKPTKLPRQSKHTLWNGDTIEVPLPGKQHGQSIRFSVKMPVRSELGLEKYTQNCFAYVKCVEQAERQYGFLIEAQKEARKNGNAPVIPPVPMRALPQGSKPDPSPHTSLLAAATGGNTHGMRWGGGAKYNVVAFVGSGAFATVYKLSSKRDGVVYAAKQLDKKRLGKEEGQWSKIYNELNVIKSLRHPNIVKYVDHHETSQYLFIIMEFVRFGDLSSWTHAGGPMPEYMAMHVARQILQAIDYLHKRGITHRDLKPDNVLMESDCPYTFKLSDFGLSKIVTVDNATFLKTFCGTMMYCAPEVYPGYQRVKASLPSKSPPAKSKYDHTFPYQHSVDIWGLGAVLYHLLSGEPPFTARHDPEGENMLWNVMRQPVNWERLKMVGVSHTGINFLSRMLVTDAAERASDAELLDHPWICAVKGPADASDCVLSDPAERSLSAHASQLSIGDEQINKAEGSAGDATEDPGAFKRALAWLPDMTRNVWGETASMVVRNQQQANRADQPPLDMEYPPPFLSAHNEGTQPQPNRLFGEIGASALASSGALGLEGNRALRVQGPGPGNYDSSSDALYNDSRAGSPEDASAPNVSTIRAGVQENANPGTTQDVQNSHRLPGPTHSGGAPSLLGTEALVGQLNMASTGSGASAQADNGKPARAKLTKAHDSSSPQLTSKRSGQDMLPPKIERASKRPKIAGVEQPSGEPPNMFEGYSSARRASIEDLRQMSMSPKSRPGSRGSNYDGYQENQQSRGAYKSNYDLPTTAFHSSEWSQVVEAEDDVIMGDGRDSDDEVVRLEEALAAAKARKAAKLGSHATSSHADSTSTTGQPMTGSAIFDATAHLAPSATASFVKPPLRFGKLQPTRGSIQTPTIYITERLTTYGRKPDSTFVHPDPREDRIPKQALDIQMWYPGIEADIDAGKTDWMFHPKLEAILRTHASLYVLVNGIKLKKGKGEYLWGRLRTGDKIAVVEPSTGATSARDKEYLRFRCEFFIGLSKKVRKPGEKAFVVEVEKDKFQVAEARKSRGSTAAPGASKDGGGPSTGKGKGREVDEAAVYATNASGKS